MEKHYKSAMSYNIIFACLEMLMSVNIIDEEYNRLFFALFNYVDSKINIGCGGDIIDHYAVYVVDEIE